MDAGSPKVVNLTHRPLASTLNVLNITVKAELRRQLRLPVFVSMVVKLIPPRVESSNRLHREGSWQLLRPYIVRRWHRRLRNILRLRIGRNRALHLLSVKLIDLIDLILLILLLNKLFQLSLFLQFQLSLQLHLVFHDVTVIVDLFPLRRFLVTNAFFLPNLIFKHFTKLVSCLCVRHFDLGHNFAKRLSCLSDLLRVGLIVGP